MGLTTTHCLTEFAQLVVKSGVSYHSCGSVYYQQTWSGNDVVSRCREPLKGDRHPKAPYQYFVGLRGTTKSDENEPSLAIQ